MYGATEEDDKVKGQKVNPKVTGRVMNVYTNPSDQLDHMTAEAPTGGRQRGGSDDVDGLWWSE